MRVACVLFDKNAPTSKIAEHFLRFSPQICIRKDEAIFVEIGKSRRLFRDDTFLARVQVILRKLKLSAKVTLGKDVTDSLALAKYGSRCVDDLPLNALVEFADPFDRDEVVTKQVQNLVVTFRDLGVKTIGDFKKIPVSELISRYGIIGRHCHQRIQMMDLIGWPLWAPEEKISEYKQFPYFEFYGELDPILFEMKTQLDQIFMRLKSREKRLTRLRVIITCEKSSAEPVPRKQFDFEFHSPQSEAKGTLRILKERLSRHFEKEPIRSPIEQIESHVLNTVPFGGAQRNIFGNEEEKFESINSLHNQLVEILGKDNVFQASLTEDRRPERSWQKLLASPHLKFEEESNIDIANLIPERSTYLCRHPMKLEVTAGFVHIKGKRYRILNWNSDVERISGGWYEKPNSEIKNTFDRNYYQVEIEGHQRIVIFETPNRQFYLHGYYG